ESADRRKDPHGPDRRQVGLCPREAPLMAASFERAFAEIAGPEFDRIVYGGRRFPRAPEDCTLAEALKDLDREWQTRLAGWLAHRGRCSPHDAEDAIED